MNVSILFARLTAWLGSASPWLLGLFGGAGATLLWEGALKPRRERRALAHVLAVEVGFNLQLAASALAISEHNPNSVPQDFRFLTRVFESVAERLGALPTALVGQVVLLYAGIEAVNRIPEQFAHTLEVRDDLRANSGRLHGGMVSGSAAGAREKELELQITTFKSGLATALERANALLPQLRRAAVPLWRVDYYFRRKEYLSLDRVGKDMAERAKRLGISAGRRSND